MKYIALAVATVGLLVQAVTAYAISFSPPRSIAVPAAEAGVATKWTVGLSASSWNLPDSPGIDFSSKLRPLVTADYQINEKVSVGGWYNPIAWEANLTSFGVTGDIDGAFFELHGTYNLPQDYAVQLGYQHVEADVSVGSTDLGTLVARYATVWGLKTFTFPVAGESKMGVLVGLGLQQGVDSQSGSLAGNALVGASYAISPRLSADASAWFNDFTRSDNNVVRFTAGVTGRF